jgi:hypothetical protein
MLNGGLATAKYLTDWQIFQRAQIYANLPQQRCNALPAVRRSCVRRRIRAMTPRRAPRGTKPMARRAGLP